MIEEIIVYIFLLTPNLLFGQSILIEETDGIEISPISDRWVDNSSRNSSFDYQIGHNYINIDNLIQIISSSNVDFQPIETRGIYFKSGNAQGDLGFFGIIWAKEMSISYNHLQTLNFYTDTSTSAINGYNFSINYGKDILQKYRFIDIIPYYGYTFGRLRLDYMDTGNKNLELTNSLIGINFLLEIKTLYKTKKGIGVNIGVKGGYQFDFSKSTWKSKEDRALSLPGIKQSGAFTSINLGIAF